jgi:23S rRNA (pseudouridine1915-N3)-methyltransferase
LRFVFVGRGRGPIFEAGGDYFARLKRYTKADEEFVKDVQVARALAAADVRVVLAIEGRAFDSVAFARQVATWQNRSVKEVAFAVGGADGFATEIRASASLLWSLSPLTLQHDVARVVLLEQVYRAFTILRGEPYHH